MRPRLRVCLATLFIATLASPALAAWPNSPFTNLPVCTAGGGQFRPMIVSDGAGGAIVTWYDYRGGAADIYAQHILASGAVDPAWPAHGRTLCAAANDQFYVMLVTDGAGGAIATWQDARGGAVDIYAQHVLASGAVDPAWPADGRALCMAPGYQSNAEIVSDGAGGAIVTWFDFRTGTADVYAQHVLASGAVDPAWPADGRALCVAAGEQSYPTLVSDGSGGAIATWQDFRSGTNTDIYAQHVLASGAVDPAWPADGRALCVAAGERGYPTLVTDGAGGAIVTWNDRRGGTEYDIYAQHVLTSGTVDPMWPVDGRALCLAASLQNVPTLVTDGAGGAIVAWIDLRSGTEYDIYAQHVLASGAADPAWPADGRALCVAAGDQYSLKIEADGVGGAIVAWLDRRSGTEYDIYAQHVLTSGAVDPTWPANGRALSTAANVQSFAAVAPDGAGGTIVTWQDLRSASTTDIYAQRVARHGYLGTPEAEIVSVKDVPNDQGGRVKVSWNASYLDLAQDGNLNAYDVLRSVPPNVAARMRARGVPVRALEGDGFALRPGDLIADATSAYYWEYLTSVTPLHYLSGYSLVAPTLGDSVAGSNPKTAFMVVARNWSSSMYWLSRPDSGYSVDNLAPAMPAPFSGQYAGGSASLHWDANVESDLAGYRLYRGPTSGFVPGPGNLVAAIPGTSYTDTPGALNWYKLTAVDSHGNESAVATLLPSGTVGVEDGAQGLSFAAPMPNPAGTRTTLRFSLPQACAVRVAVYDAAGRLVRELANGARDPGEHEAVWDLRDRSDRAVGAGLYFARFEALGNTRVRRIVVAQ